jgi:urease accessory protein
VSVADQHGFLGLQFRQDARRRTALSRCEQRFPLRMTVPMYLDDVDRGMAFIYVQNPTGGVFADDHLVTEVGLGAGCRVHLTSQSATKLYDMNGGHASHELRFALEEDSYLEYMPDALIPQAGSRFAQRSRISVASGASCIMAELVGPGRRARGERFAYGELTLDTEVRGEGGVLCGDALHLDPSTTWPATSGILGQRDYLASMLVVAPGHDVDRLVAGLTEAVDAQDGDLGAAAPLPNDAGAFVRVLSSTGAQARRSLLSAWRIARAQLVNLPLPRTRK